MLELMVDQQTMQTPKLVNESYDERYTPEDWDEQRKRFVLRLAALVKWNNLSKDDVYNMDQTGILFNPTAQGKTRAEKGSKNDVLYNNDDKASISLSCVVTASGETLPLQYIFKGEPLVQKGKNKGKKQMRSCPENCPEGALFHQTKNHWASEETNLALIDEIIVPHSRQRNEQRQRQGYPSRPIIIILDNWKVHTTESFRNAVKQKYGDYVRLMYLPPNMTSKVQPLDVSVNSQLKQKVRSIFGRRVAEEYLASKENQDGDLGRWIYKGLNKNRKQVLVDVVNEAWHGITATTVNTGWQMVWGTSGMGSRYAG